MDDSLPFNRLPRIPRLLILEYLSVIQFFTFSLLSKKTTEIARSNKKRVGNFYWDINNSRKRHKLTLTIDGGKWLTVQVPLDPWRMMMSPSEVVTFDGEDMIMCRDEEGSDDYLELGCMNLSDNGRLQFLDDLSKHFLAVFEVASLNFYINRPMNLVNCFVWRYTKNLEKLYINQLEMNHVVSANDMKFIFEELSVNQLRVFGKIEAGFQWTKPLKTINNHFEYGNCLSLETFLNTQCKIWDISVGSLPAAYLNAVIKKWVAGGLEMLISFRVASLDNEEDGLDEVLEGIETAPLNVENRPEQWREASMDHGLDIRNQNGLLASAALDDDGFMFIVWRPTQ